MNENNNRVTAVFSGPQLTDFDTALATLDGLTAGLQSLTAEERDALPKINEANLVFVQDALNQMNTPAAAAFLPPYLLPATAQTDLTVYNQIETLLARIDSIRAQLDAHRTLAGAEAYRTTLTFFTLAKAAAVAGIPGAQAVVDALAPRFAAQGGGAPQQQTP